VRVGGDGWGAETVWPAEPRGSAGRRPASYGWWFRPAGTGPATRDQRPPRLTAATTARSEAVTMFASMPTPQTTVPATSAST
jgi:hypothetical protein